MNWKPEGYTSLAPYLLVGDAEEVLRFAELVFGAERLRVVRDEGRIVHAECRIDDTVLMMGEAPGGPPVNLHIYMQDPDSAYRRALAAGATSVQPVGEKGDGDRRGGVRSPDGTLWWLAKQV